MTPDEAAMGLERATAIRKLHKLIERAAYRAAGNAFRLLARQYEELRLPDEELDLALDNWREDGWYVEQSDAGLRIEPDSIHGRVLFRDTERAKTEHIAQVVAPLCPPFMLGLEVTEDGPDVVLVSYARRMLCDEWWKHLTTVIQHAAMLSFGDEAVGAEEAGNEDD